MSPYDPGVMDQAVRKVAFIGVGRMGKPIAVNIVKAGYELIAYDLRHEQLQELTKLGAKAAPAPADAARDADVVEIIVVDDAQVEQVMTASDGVLQAVHEDAIVAIHSTVFPATVHKLAALAQPKGVHLIDVPVSGGEAGARDRSLCYMAGGDPAVLDRCRDLFGTSAAEIYHLGALGNGAAAKMILQVVVCINMLAASEAEVLAQKCGLDFALLQQVLHKSASQSFVVDNWLHRFKLEQDPMPIRQRRTEVFQKSLGPSLEMAQALGLSLEGAELAQRLMPQIMGIVERATRGTQ